MEDECSFNLEVVVDKYAAGDFLMEVEFDRDNSEVSMGHFCSDEDQKFPPRDSEISGDQDVQENSNDEGSKIASDRLDSDLVLGITSSNYSPQCSDISLMETTPSTGKAKVLSNLCSLVAFLIKISRLNIS